MPQLKTRLLRAVALAGLALSAACASDPTGLQPQASTRDAVAAQAVTAADLAAALDAFKTYLTTTILARATELPAAVTVTQTIGSAGGKIAIPALGFELVVPQGAVSKNTLFTVTALAGKSIAYEFGPHGTKFKKSLIFRQNAAYTTGWWNATSGGYFKSSDQVDTHQGKAKVDEIMPLVWDGFWLTLKIDHFSGYLVSCA